MVMIVVGTVVGRFDDCVTGVDDIGCIVGSFVMTDGDDDDTEGNVDGDAKDGVGLGVVVIGIFVGMIDGADRVVVVVVGFVVGGVVGSSDRGTTLLVGCVVGE